MNAGAATAARVSVRDAGPGDLDAVTALLCERDGVSRRREDVARNLAGLEPSLLRGWIAEVDGKPAGFTSLYMRTMRWGGEERRAGYWAHLFVREEHRRLMIYPQLVLSMMRAARAEGSVIFTGTRRPQVAETHRKMGFTQVGAPRVWALPLRPARLVVKHKGLPGILGALGAPLDWAWSGLAARAQRGVLSRPAPALGEAELASLAGLLNELGEGLVSQRWTVEALRARLAGAIDGGVYEAMTGDGWAAIVCLTERGAGIRTGVVLEAAAKGGDQARAKALRIAAGRLAAMGAEVALALEGAALPASVLGSSGWRRTEETYHMLVWPKEAAAAESAAGSYERWRFSFLDHDAF